MKVWIFWHIWLTLGISKEHEVRKILRFYRHNKLLQSAKFAISAAFMFLILKKKLRFFRAAFRTFSNTCCVSTQKSSKHWTIQKQYSWCSQQVSGLNFSRSYGVYLPQQPLEVLFPRFHGLVCWKPALCVHRVWRNSSFYQELQRSLCDYRDGGFPWTKRFIKFRFKLGKTATEC